jgi:hypothetical protein
MSLTLYIAFTVTDIFLLVILPISKGHSSLPFLGFPHFLLLDVSFVSATLSTLLNRSKRFWFHIQFLPI